MRTRHPRRYEEDNLGSEIRIQTRETGMLTRRQRESQVRTAQITPVQTNSGERGWEENHTDTIHRSRRRESRMSTTTKANSELSSGVRAILETNGKSTPTTTTNIRTSTDQTPLRSINGSESSATPRKRKIKLRSKGT